ncbi:MAG TPA: 1-(5-phosphoribosyl)-5-[(5-phosphoribosylamino)methylideneamino]imidazole-4-carboxamide isomerase [Solirubrobacteraceae bacterium]|jgi:phosphoribosylformimino-5-aminoimidazole carboxamide ribotide isomerase|nr:1-(5-phosphoribosyl)-5-[(5-phosphoribosylamino)methylideneamino]imidazole-4-carboxamide isomerase [Solirubrobacteraceae bacterium]
MILYPAIDIMEGKAVRLVKGDFEAKKVYDEDPLAAASRWVGEGAEHLHVVDLDGARAGAPVNLEHVRRITGELDVPVQLGGGLRTLEAIAQALAAGAERVILGTAAFTDPELLDESLREWPDRMMVSVDTRGGRVTTAGWTETTELTAQAVIAALQERGVQRVVYTNVDRDGMLEGPDVQEIEEIARSVQGNLVYSGGIGALEDLERLQALGQASLRGVIVGKALYEGRFTVAEARAVLG